jgi:hypothetical protein
LLTRSFFLLLDPSPISYGAPVAVVVQPSQYFFYQVNSSLIPETDWSLNVTLDNGNKKDGVKMYLSYEYIPRQNDYDYSGYGYVAIPFPSQRTLFITLQNKGTTEYYGTLLASAGVIR